MERHAKRLKIEYQSLTKDESSYEDDVPTQDQFPNEITSKYTIPEQTGSSQTISYFCEDSIKDMLKLELSENNPNLELNPMKGNYFNHINNVLRGNKAQTFLWERRHALAYAHVSKLVSEIIVYIIPEDVIELNQKLDAKYGHVLYKEENILMQQLREYVAILKNSVFKYHKNMEDFDFIHKITEQIVDQYHVNTHNSINMVKQIHTKVETLLIANRIEDEKSDEQKAIVNSDDSDDDYQGKKIDQIAQYIVNHEDPINMVKRINARVETLLITNYIKYLDSIEQEEKRNGEKFDFHWKFL